MADRYLLVNSENKEIVNIIMLAENSTWNCPEGFNIFPDNGQSIGEFYVG